MKSLHEKPTTVTPVVVCICHELPSGKIYYHLGPGCCVSKNADEAAHYPCDDPEAQAGMVREHLRFAERQNQNPFEVSLSKIKTFSRTVGPRKITSDDRLAFQRRFGYDPKTMKVA